MASTSQLQERISKLAFAHRQIPDTDLLGTLFALAVHFDTHARVFDIEALHRCIGPILRPVYKALALAVAGMPEFANDKRCRGIKRIWLHADRIALINQ